MKLYKIERINSADWDEYIGGVIAAGTRSEARKIAKQALSTHSFFDKAEIWLDPNKTKLTEFGPAHLNAVREPGVVLDSFKAG